MQRAHNIQRHLCQWFQFWNRLGFTDDFSAILPFSSPLTTVSICVWELSGPRGGSEVTSRCRTLGRPSDSSLFYSASFQKWTPSPFQGGYSSEGQTDHKRRLWAQNTCRVTFINMMFKSFVPVERSVIISLLRLILWWYDDLCCWIADVFCCLW
jgi:hypothetical protein